MPDLGGKSANFLMRVDIHQIYYRDEQKPSLDQVFIPYNNANKKFPYNFEYAVFFDLFERVVWNETSLLGTVSWKFHLKTGLTGKEFLEAVDTNPGYDVYFTNPFPELCVYRSVWQHGNEYHADLKSLTQRLLTECGYSSAILDVETPPNLTAYCNYWAANEVFWRAYIEFLKPLWIYILTNDNELTRALQEPADPFIKAPYLPFVFERLFSTFLSINNFKVFSVPVAPSRLLGNPFLAPIASKILKATMTAQHKNIPLYDRLVMYLFSRVRKLRHYYLPMVKRRLLK